MMEDIERAIPTEQGLALPDLVNLPVAVQTIITTAGTLQTDDTQRAILYAPVDQDVVQIRPDGLVYLPWSFYAKRLFAAFGSSWSLVQSGEPQREDNLILVRYLLFVQGKYVATAYGEQEYHPNNKTMSYGDAIEATKSNALLRVCKAMGMCLELWDKDFVEDWKAKYADKEWNSKRNRNDWFKRTGKIINDGGKVEDKTEPEEQVKPAKPDKPKAPENGDKNTKYGEISRIIKKIGWSPDDLREVCSQSFPLFSVVGNKPILTWIDGELAMVKSAEKMSSNQLGELVEALKALEVEFDKTGNKPKAAPITAHLQKIAFAVAKERGVGEGKLKEIAYKQELLDADNKVMSSTVTGEIQYITSRTQLKAHQWIDILKELEPPN